MTPRSQRGGREFESRQVHSTESNQITSLNFLYNEEIILIRSGNQLNEKSYIYPYSRNFINQ